MTRLRGVLFLYDALRALWCCVTNLDSRLDTTEYSYRTLARATRFAGCCGARVAARVRALPTKRLTSGLLRSQAVCDACARGQRERVCVVDT